MYLDGTIETSIMSGRDAETSSSTIPSIEPSILIPGGSVEVEDLLLLVSLLLSSYFVPVGVPVQWCLRVLFVRIVGVVYCL